jgi:hypothetical protein
MAALNSLIGSGSSEQHLSGRARTAAITSSMLTGCNRRNNATDDVDLNDGGDAPAVADRTPATLSKKR